MAFLLTKIFEKEKWSVSIYRNGSDLFKHLAASKADDDQMKCFVLDIMVPGFKGDEIVDLIRQKYKNALIMMHSAIDDSQKRVECLVIGADHYLVKPYPARVLIQHIKHHINKVRRDTRKTRFMVGPWEIHFKSRYAIWNEKKVKLEHKEMAILECLFNNQNEVTKATLLREVWEIDSSTMSTNRLESCISSIRKKLGKTAIILVPKKGYKIGFE